MLTEEKEPDQVLSLLIENQRLLVENNLLLKKINKYSVWSFWFKLIWSLVIIFLPFALYFLVVETYLESIGLSLESLRASYLEVSDWVQFYQSAGVGENRLKLYRKQVQ